MKTQKQAVWESPVDYNRAARRAERLFGSIWKWNPQNVTDLPRYVRRHAGSLEAPKTRRQRKQRARIMRIMADHV